VTAFAERLVRPIARVRWRAVLVVLAVAAAILGIQAYRFDNQALPGVRVLGIDVGGKDRNEIGAAVWVNGRVALARPVVLRARHGVVTVRPSSVLRIDPRATAAAVLAAGRSSRVIQGAYLLDPVSSHDVAPVFRVREKGLAAVVARVERFGRPPRSAEVAMNGLEPVVSPARAGLVVDRDGLVAALESAVSGSDRPLVATFRRAEPRIADEAAMRSAASARLAVSAPVDLTYAGRAVGTLAPARLAALLAFAPEGDHYRTTFDAARLARALRPSVAPWRKRAVNARFVARGDSVSIAPSRSGRDVDPETVQASVTAAALSRDERIAPLALHAVPPDRTTTEAQALGISKRLASFTTDMGPSSANRIHNVHLMADYVDGTVIEPGKRFSFNGVVGPRTPERGFLEGQMIVGTLVLPSIGGGVCQTATTLFNDAFALGLPVLERHNHSLYISHYPLGRDATVSWGGPDLVFKNDLEHGLLITTSYTDSTLTFSFWGTPEGRTVTSRTGPKTDWKSPEMSYAIDPNAPAGSARVIGGTNEAGFEVTVWRTVKDAEGRVLRRNSFHSTYVPQGPTTVYGPGAHPPGPYVVLPTEP
jgi:vancomycin resistance protein YoaR